MHKFFALVFLTSAVLPAVAQPRKNIGNIDVEVKAAIHVRISANHPELQALAQTAFRSHGRYVVDNSSAGYDLKFTVLGPNQIRVDITRGAAATPVASQVVNGNSARNALLRAADVAVEKTSGIPGLRGYFTAQLVFLSQRTGKSEVYTSDLFPGPAKQLTHDGALAMTPRWAPDGSRIIYTSYFKSGAPDIYLLDPNTARRDIFINYRGTNMGARFSPNGQQIAMILTGEGAPEIYVRGAQGGPVVRKTRSDSVKSSPCFSPDGGQIVFAMEPGPQLYVMSAAGGSPRRLSSQFSYMAEPDWSRTERNKIVCTVRSRGYQIAVVDVASGEAKQVSQAPFDAVEPSWLADGRHVVYTARDRRTSVLCILDTETGKSTAITPIESAALQASVWTP